VSGAAITEILSVPGLIPGLVVSVALGLVGGRRVGRALGARPVVGALLIFGFGLAVSSTLTPSVDALTRGFRGSGVCDLSRLALAGSSQLARGGEVALNVLLLVPLGVGIGLLPWRRSSSVVLTAAVALPVAIELTQLVVTRLGRQCQGGDVIDNLTGFAIGALAAVGVRWLVGVRTIDRSDRRRVAANVAAGSVASLAGLGLLLAMVVAPGRSPGPPPLPSAPPTPPIEVVGESVHVASIPELLDALADDAVGEIVVADGVYHVSTAATQGADSLWIGTRFASRTKPVLVRAQTPGGVILDGSGASFFGGISFEQGAHHQTWDGFVFANGTPTQTGVITFGGYAGEAAPHHITLRNITIDRSITSGAAGATDHGIYVSRAVGGPHDLLFEEIKVDGTGGLSSAFHFYGSDDANPNAWNVTIRRLSVVGTQQAIMLWDPTLHDITIDTAVIADTRDYAVRFESPGATEIVLANITSTGSGSGKGFESSLGSDPPGVTFVNDSLR
jgi:hypothetical protein